MNLDCAKPSGEFGSFAALKGVSLSLDDIVILSPQRTQFRDLRRTIEGVTQMSVSGERLNLERIPMQDAYVYAVL